MPANTRDLFNHASGKGDKPRTKYDANWVRRFKKVKGMGTRPDESAGWEKTKQGFRKRY